MEYYGFAIFGRQFADTLKAAGVAISMDGSGRHMDNIFIEPPLAFAQVRGRLPARTLRHLPDPTGHRRWMAFYNTQTPHSTLDGSTPAETSKKEMLMEIQAEPHRAPAPRPAQPEHGNVLNGTPAA